MRRWPIPVWIAAAALSAFYPESLQACKCLGTSVCDAFATSDIVFVGRAESVNPDFDPWDPATAKQLEEMSQGSDLSGADSNRSPEQLARLKAYFSRFFSGERRDRITRASTLDEVEKVVDEGRNVTFTVLRRYKGLPDSVRQTEVWTDFSECGPYFLKGETYLVYAGRADNGRIEGGACSRTKRLTDAGDDLAYLHFQQVGGTAVTRVFGFVTHEERDLQPPGWVASASRPVPYLVIELRSSGTKLLSGTDKDGQFAFDGLGPGDYTLSVFDDYLAHSPPLTEPRHVRIDKARCVDESIYIPRDRVRRP